MILKRHLYSPDLSPTDFHLFQLQESIHILKKVLEIFFRGKPQISSHFGINTLICRWAEIVESEGDYIIHDNTSVDLNNLSIDILSIQKCREISKYSFQQNKITIIWFLCLMAYQTP